MVWLDEFLKIGEQLNDIFGDGNGIDLTWKPPDDYVELEDGGYGIDPVKPISSRYNQN